ncbi:MAG TPA: zinc-binding dehydrogenase [Pyrinomonadaceae bacterium]|jgi:NADPH:quinone reductase-like Zn-dependent oxidoreductase
MRTIPATMRALELRDYEGRPESLALVEKPVPRPGRGEVLVRIEAAPANPSDMMFLRGLYGQKKPLPVVAGFEGAGEVVSSGGGLVGRALVGRRVACAAPFGGDGTWAEYMVTPASMCIPLRREVTFEQGAAMIVNPFSAWALMKQVRHGLDRAVAQSAAASALGRMINSLAKRRRLPLVNIVRRQEQVELLRGEGAEHVLNSTEPDFEERLRDLCRRLKVTLAFDAVAGEMTGQLLRSTQKGGRVFVYGALSMDACQIDPRSLIFEGKRVEGFWLSEWLRSQNPAAKFITSMRVQKLLATDLHTDIRSRLPLEAATEGLSQYATHMTGGKILFVPGLREGSG